MKRPEKTCRGEVLGIGERSSALPAGCFAARSARWARTPLGSAPIEAGVRDGRRRFWPATPWLFPVFCNPGATPEAWAGVVRCGDVREVIELIGVDDGI